jgi:hypothetical protein
MVALNERLPDNHKLLPPAGQPGPHEGRRRSLRELVADRRAARAARHTGPLPPGLAEWLADRQRQAEQHTDQRRVGAVAERRVAEALRAWATDPDLALGPEHPGDPPAEQERDWQGEERDHEHEEDFGDSWRTYQERANYIRQTYGWTVPEPPRAENWLPLGRDDDQEHDEPPDRSHRWQGAERDNDRDDR